MVQLRKSVRNLLKLLLRLDSCLRSISSVSWWMFQFCISLLLSPFGSVYSDKLGSVMD